MLIKTVDLIGLNLDRAVAKAEGAVDPYLRGWSPSTKWSHGGPIIDRERPLLEPTKDGAYCSMPSQAEPWHNHPVTGRGPTYLIAAMRCYVTSKLGDEVDVPEDQVDGRSQQQHGPGD